MTFDTGNVLYNQCPYDPKQAGTVTRKASGVAAAASADSGVKPLDDIPAVKIPGGMPSMVYKALTKGWKSIFDLPSALHLQYFDLHGPIFK